MLSPDLLAARDLALSTLAWWREAGLDTLVEDAPRDWLTRPNPLPSGERVAERSDAGRGAVRDSAPLPGRSAAVPLPCREREIQLPDTLDAFVEYLRTSDAIPEAAWGRTRLLPGGDAAAGLMILVDMPDVGDAEGGQLMAGPVGALFDRMLAAIGRARDSVWLAPLTTVRPVGGRIDPAAAARLADMARHQIGLVAPRRLLIMGDAPNRALFGAETLKMRGRYHSLNLRDRTIEAVATFHPRLLLQRPAYKAEAWRDLQLLMKGF